MGSIDETDCPSSRVVGPPLPSPPRNFNLPELRRLFLPPWLCGPSVPLMRAETRVGCAVCMPSRVGPQSQGKAARPSMRTFVLGFPLWAFRRERGWLAAAAGPMGQWTGAPESRASFSLSRPLRPSRCSLFRDFLCCYLNSGATPPFFPRACHDCNRRGGVVALVPGTHRRPSRSMVDPTGPRRAEPQPTCWLSVPPRPIRAAHSPTVHLL